MHALMERRAGYWLPSLACLPRVWPSLWMLLKMCFLIGRLATARVRNTQLGNLIHGLTVLAA